MEPLPQSAKHTALSSFLLPGVDKRERMLSRRFEKCDFSTKLSKCFGTYVAVLEQPRVLPVPVLPHSTCENIALRPSRGSLRLTSWISRSHPKFGEILLHLHILPPRTLSAKLPGMGCRLSLM